MTQRLRKAVGLLVSSALVLAPAVGRARSAPDPAAIRDATRALETPHRWVSAQSLYHYLRAVIVAQRHDREGALRELRLAALYETENAYPHDALAAALLDEGDFTAARQEARRALEMAPHDARAWVVLGRVDEAEGHHARAMAAARRALALAPRQAAALELAVRVSLARHALGEARSRLEQLADVDAASGTGRDRRAAGRLCADVADAEAAAGNDAAALALYRKAATLEPTAPRFAALGAFLETRGQSRDAAEAYAQAISRSGDDPALMAKAARLYLDAGEAPVAAAYIDAIAHAGVVPGREAKALLALGSAFENRNQLDRAQRAFDAARALAPQDTKPLLVLGGLFERQNRCQRALAQFELAAKLDPHDPAIAVGLARARTRAGGRPDLARLAWKRARTLARARGDVALEKLAESHLGSPAQRPARRPAPRSARRE